MAIHQQEEESHSSLFDALYCEEEKWEDDDVEEEDDDDERRTNGRNPCLLPILLLEQDLFWEDEELISLFIKEKQGSLKQGILDDSLLVARKEAVEWMLKVNSHYGFCTLTSVLAVNYLDRFLSSFHFQKDKPWMMQIAAVTCVSLAAKVEETHVPLLLDLQVEGTKYVFEAKTIQKMELLVLSTLEWKMNPVTPLSFLDHIIRRLGLKNHLHWEFFRRCEGLLLSVLSDGRFITYLPSVLATATMMHVIDQIEPCDPLDYHNQLLGVLNISKERVNECYQMIVEVTSTSRCNKAKRKFGQMMNTTNSIIPSSPNGVIDAYYLSSDSSNDSWNVTGRSSVSSSISSSPAMSRKKGRVNEQPMPLQLPSLSRVFVDVIGSPH